VPLDAAAGLYEKASLTYRVDAGQLSIPLALSRIEGQLVSYDEVASGPLPNHAIGTLEVRYPHSAGKPDMAEARVVIVYEGDQASKQKTREVWTLDLPKAELDRMYEALRAANFFKGQPIPTAGIEITARLNGREVHKRWQAVPDLDDLMQQVRRRGQLASYKRAPTLRDPAGLLSSVAAYRQLIARDGGGDLPRSGPLVATRSGVEAPNATGAAQIARLPAASRGR
jgi:hypothetical protein